ncbi:MAG: glycoside hydrolase family 5 protein [Ruminococcus sp.]|jgi:endoglucanase|nr:glycoside hydrolase family 5 protein [Ruminococcus sp.]
MINGKDAGMKIGWNLGNTLDAYNHDVKGLLSETSWYNPKATASLIHAVKNAGFNAVRIPITWITHTDESYTIDKEWFSRVKEVVAYVLDEGMYAIINIHHDGNGEEWLRPDTADREEMYRRFAALWKQIAAEFSGYDKKLLFEGMNEFHVGYNDPSEEWLAITDELNQLFVDTVRATNPDRILIVPSYNTQTAFALKMKLPRDSAKDALIVEVHSYDPWSFAGEGKGTWGTDADKADVDERFDLLVEKFIKKGIPVILGEYGVVTKADSESRLKHIEYTTKAAMDRGIVPFYWDDGGIFEILDRKTEKFDENSLKAIMNSLK